MKSAGMDSSLPPFPPGPSKNRPLGRQALVVCGFVSIFWRHQIETSFLACHFSYFSSFSVPAWLHFGAFFHHSGIASSSMNFALLFTRFFMDLCPDLSSVFHIFCTRSSLHDRTWATLFLNNSMVFCAQKHVFPISKRLYFPCNPLPFSLPGFVMFFY